MKSLDVDPGGIIAMTGNTTRGANVTRTPVGFHSSWSVHMEHRRTLTRMSLVNEVSEFRFFHVGSQQTSQEEMFAFFARLLHSVSKP